MNEKYYEMTLKKFTSMEWKNGTVLLVGGVFWCNGLRRIS
jgi:hypothetical protein